MWIVAAIAAGTVLAWPFVLVVAKPTFAPIALLGSVAAPGGLHAGVLAGLRSRSCRVWLDWFTVVRNSDVGRCSTTCPRCRSCWAPLVAWATGRSRPQWIDRVTGQVAAVVPVQIW